VYATESEWMVSDAALNPGQVCVVCLRDLVLFLQCPARPSVSLPVRIICTTSDRHTVQVEFHSAIPAWSQRSQHSGDLDVVRGLQPSVIWQPTLTTTQTPLFLSVMACHSSERTQANPLYLTENLIS